MNTTNVPQTIQVLLVDDHNVVRSGLATFLRAYKDLELVGEARNGLEALESLSSKETGCDLDGPDDAGDGWHRRHPCHFGRLPGY